MEDFSKVREQKNQTMSFKEYKEKEGNNAKPKKFGKIMKSILLYPFKFAGAFLDITPKSLTSGDFGSGIKGGRNSDFRENYRVPNPPTRRRTHEDYMNERRATEAYLRMVDGKGDPKPHCDCDHER